MMTTMIMKLVTSQVHAYRPLAKSRIRIRGWARRSSVCRQRAG
jgi:hypothetical protein